MIALEKDALVFRFPDLHTEAVCRVDFQRTLRIPDDNREYPLPPGLGRFSLEHVEDHAERLPAAWGNHGGALLPMYQAEALWINLGFDRWRNSGYPFAVKIAAGKINAVTGEPWSAGLSKGPQDYIVVPDQRWLDGFCVQEGLIRQFVAMPLGKGYTAEEQITGEAEHGGIQIIVMPMKLERYEALLRQQASTRHMLIPDIQEISCCADMSEPSMGLAPGGLMRQQIFEDPYGYDAWDQTNSSRCFVHLLNSAQWKAATGKTPPGKAPSAAEYTKAGLPWFDYYDDKLAALAGAKTLATLDSVAAKGVKLGEKPLQGNVPVEPKKVVHLGKDPNRVSEGQW
jgi:hypothetical protein